MLAGFLLRYCGACVVEDASVGMNRKATDLAIALSSGENTRRDRAQRIAREETAAKAEMEKEEREGNKSK